MNRHDSVERAAKSLPRVKQLLVPVFNFFVQHDFVTSEHCAAYLADQFGLSKVQRTDCGNGHEPRFHKRIEFVFNILSGEGGLIEQVRKTGSRNLYRITSDGRELAADKEDYITGHLNELYRDYYAPRRRKNDEF
jgi:hypothetical protein